MQQWQQFIKTQKAGDVCETEFITDLNDLGLILITGDDAESFLQNQLSNDISDLSETAVQFSSFSSPKGRMYAIFRVIRIDNGFILITARQIQLDVMQRLHKFILMSKVSIADANGHFVRVGVVSNNQDIQQITEFSPTEQMVEQSDSLIVINVGKLENQHRYILLGLDFNEIKKVWTELAKTLQITDFKSWRLSEINSGIPVILNPTSEAFVLQMSNLDQLNGVSFKKGCYPGQEIVARMHYLGKLKRRMFLASLQTEVCPKAGDELMLKGAETASGNGKVVDAVIDSKGLCQMLYIAQINKVETNSLCLPDQPEIEIKNRSLPYQIDNS